MLRSHRLGLLLVCSWLSACSMVVDFDRSRIETGAADEDASVDSSTDPGDIDANLPDANLPDANLPDGHSAACTSESDCTGNQLCCDSVCVEPSVDQCTACGQGCSVQGAGACVNRTCECAAGSGAECTADAPFCVGAEGSKACVECQEPSDCAGRADGKNECVNNVCAACNPANDAGCGGTTPICSAATLRCEKCTMGANDNCDAPLICTTSGACGGCADSEKDCKNPTAPICDDATTQCQACESHAECRTEFGNAPGSRQYCVDDSRCSVCGPSTEIGCSDAGTPDCRMNATTNRYECQACRWDADCANLAGKNRCNAGNGQCMQCVSSGHCPGAQVCDPDTNSCVTCLADAQCGNNHCNTATHQCQACVTNAHCGGDTPICQAGQCRGCQADNECAGALVCDLTANKCVTCVADAQCGPNHCNVATHQCQACVTNAHCGGDTPICQAGQCRGCQVDNECAGALVCDTAANKCVTCLTDAQCGTNHCNTATDQCQACVTNTHCTEPLLPICNAGTCEAAPAGPGGED